MKQSVPMLSSPTFFYYRRFQAGREDEKRTADRDIASDGGGANRQISGHAKHACRQTDERILAARTLGAQEAIKTRYMK